VAATTVVDAAAGTADATTIFAGGIVGRGAVEVRLTVGSCGGTGTFTDADRLTTPRTAVLRTAVAVATCGRGTAVETVRAGAVELRSSSFEIGAEVGG
jgi:hypothetical protein